MNKVNLLRGVAVAGLALIFAVSVLYAAGTVGRDLFLYLLVAGTALWFAGILLARRTGSRSSSEASHEHQN
ncbi:MAG TPA: hypothetical protein ENO05_00705 [Bacteroides sp.]|nr:hypothetical protein [Bacteroides sp.]